MKYDYVTDDHLKTLGAMIEDQANRGHMSLEFSMYSLVNYYHNRVGVKAIETLRVGLGALKGSGLRIRLGFIGLMAGSIFTKTIKRFIIPNSP